ncbi:hypothetical protein JCM10212_003566 [Sporobolomyces blumeae]
MQLLHASPDPKSDSPRASAIDKSSVHSLTSGQVVIDLQTAVKELVENALDAGATSIEVKFKEHGTESIEVHDNGKGIDKEDWAGIALKHHTSKLLSFADLESVSTLGFRGEALSSLCGTATLSVVTSTSTTAPVGTSLTFSRSGECVVGGKVARSKGTTVKVDRLFESLPVRRKDLIKNAKREFAKALELVQAYALISTGVRFEVKNTTKSKTMTHLQAPAAPSLRSNFSSIFAPKSLQAMMDLDLDLEVQADKSVLRWTDEAASSSTTTAVQVKGLISKPSPGNGRSAGNRQFYYVNGRPFHPAKVAKAVNEVYKGFVPGSFPTVVADFQLATDAYDVNVSPDKRTIFLHSEGNLIAALKTALDEFFRPSQSTFAMTQIGAVESTPAKGGAQRKEGEPDPASSAENDGDGEPESDSYRASKRRKLAETADEPLAHFKSETRPLEPSAAERVSSERSEGPTTTDVGIDSDAVLFAPAATFTNVTFPSLFDDVDGSFELPVPPSPIRKAAEAGRLAPSHPSSPERSSSPPRLRSDASTSQTSPAPEGTVSSPARGASSPLFRSSPSPTPSVALENRHSHESPSPPRSDAPPRPPLVAKNLRQPRLDFEPKASRADAEHGKVDRKGKGKMKQSGLDGMRSLLRNFVSGGATARSADAVESSSEGEVEEGEEAEQREGQGDGEEGGDEVEGSPADGNRETTREDDRWAERDKEGSGRNRFEQDPTDRAEQPQDDGDSLEFLEDVEMEVVEDSFRSAMPEATDDDEDELEVSESSCACVHGSPLDHEDEPVATSGDTPDARGPTSTFATALFGSAPAEIAGTVVAADTTLDVDFVALESIWTRPPRTQPMLDDSSVLDGEAPASDDLAGAGVDESEGAAEATLSRVVSKDDFAAMEIVGQFNLGFIIARRRVMASRGQATTRDVHDDLFIIDQHASDEKYNFEKLQAETVIQSQRLLAPRVLNLPSHDEITAIEHLDLLRLNGYDVVIDEDADVGERVKLLAQPVSNKTVFDIADFEELIDLISNRSGTEVVRPSKTRRMFASRACRKSVMIGKALNSRQMSSIVTHMGGMDQPWACPHGRPTMRWLAGLNTPARLDPRSNIAESLAALEAQ